MNYIISQRVYLYLFYNGALQSRRPRRRLQERVRTHSFGLGADVPARCRHAALITFPGMVLVSLTHEFRLFLEPSSSTELFVAFRPFH